MPDAATPSTDHVPYCEAAPGTMLEVFPPGGTRTRPPAATVLLCDRCISEYVASTPDGVEVLRWALAADAVPLYQCGQVLLPRAQESRIDVAEWATGWPRRLLAGAL